MNNVEGVNHKKIMRPDLIRAFELFIRQTHRLSKSRWIRQLRNMKSRQLRLEFGSNQVGSTLSQPTIENTRELAQIIRPLIHDGDRFSVRWLANNAMNDDSVSEQWKTQFHLMRKSLTAFNSTPCPVQMNPSTRPVTYQELFNIFIYGDLIHFDDEKAKHLQQWFTDSIFRTFFWTQIGTVLEFYSNAFMGIATLCKEELNKTERK